LKRLAGIFLLLLHAHLLKSQCCGGHSAVGDNTNQSTLPKGNLQFSTYYRYSSSYGYLTGDVPSKFNFVSKAYGNITGAQVGFGITKKLSVDADMVYYINRVQEFDLGSAGTSQLAGNGPSSITFSGRYNFIKNTEKNFEFTGGIGFKSPWTREPQVINSVELPLDVQPSNGAYGMTIRSFLFKEFHKSEINLFVVNAVTINGTNIKQFKDGSTFLTGVFLSKTYFEKISAILQFRNEYRTYAYRYGKRIASSGGHRYLLVPQVNYTFKEFYNISVLYEFPLYQYFFGTQLRDRYAVSVNFNMRLPVTKTAKENCEKPE